MKKECLEKVTTTAKPSSNQEENNEPQKEQDPIDVDNYNAAILFDDKSYCENIKDEQLKIECLNRWN